MPNTRLRDEETTDDFQRGLDRFLCLSFCSHLLTDAFKVGERGGWEEKKEEEEGWERRSGGGEEGEWSGELLLLLLLLSRFSRVRLCATPLMEAHQAPPSLGFSRREHWSGLPWSGEREW